eukprot:m51a1_g14669 hypothetical protein (727) ;mRNA; f:31034-33865
MEVVEAARGKEVGGCSFMSLRLGLVALSVAIAAISALPPVVMIHTSSRASVSNAVRTYLDATSPGAVATVRDSISEPANALAAITDAARSGVVNFTESWRLMLSYAAVYRSGAFGVSALALQKSILLAADITLFGVPLDGVTGLGDDNSNYYSAIVQSMVTQRMAMSKAFVTNEGNISILGMMAVQTINLGGTSSFLFLDLALPVVSSKLQERFGDPGQLVVIFDSLGVVSTSTGVGLVSPEGTRYPTARFPEKRVAAIGAALNISGITSAVYRRVSAAGGTYTVRAERFRPYEGLSWVVVVAGIVTAVVCVVCLVGLWAVSLSFGLALRSAGRSLKLIAELELNSAHEKLQGLAISRVSKVSREFSRLWSSAELMLHSLSSFQHYVPPSVVKSIVRGSLSTNLEMRSCNVTVMFMDIEQCAKLCESLGNQRFIDLITEFMDSMTAIITTCEGTIDKFIGGGIMAFWNAPNPVARHELQACTAALACRAELSRLREIWKQRGQPPLYARIGLHTGEAFAGMMGSSERMNYTLLGHTVNEASRLEPLNQAYGTDIIISDTVFAEVQVECCCRPLGLVKMHGRNPFRVYELINFEADVSAQDKRLISLFSAGLKCVEDRQFAEAKQILLEYQRCQPSTAKDLYSRDLVRLCDKMEETPEQKAGKWQFVRYIHKRLHSNIGDSSSDQQCPEYTQAEMEGSSLRFAVSKSIDSLLSSAAVLSTKSSTLYI